MILCNGEPYFPIGVYFIPCPNELPTGNPNDPEPGTFLYRIAHEGRGFCYQEFAANGGNLVIFPTFHFNEKASYRKWDHWMPSDITDDNPENPGPIDCREDLQYAAEYGIKIITDPALSYIWVPDYSGYYRSWFPITCCKRGVDPRPTPSRESYFISLKENIESSGAEEGFMGWMNFHEPPHAYYLNQRDFPTAQHEKDVYEHIKALEAAANANHAVYFEECVWGTVADMYKEYHKGCDVLAYNVRIFNAPHADWNYINNKWVSITGDTADVLAASVDGAKPLWCCVDAVWYEGWVYRDKGYFPWGHQIRFMSYDAVIHRCNGLMWGMWHYVFPSSWNVITPAHWYETDIKPTIAETGLGETHAMLKAQFDDTTVAAVVTKEGAPIEKTAFVGGDLAPKTHLCSSRYLMEGCVKYYDGHVYLIAACREGRDSDTHEPINTYDVTFRPYFSGVWTDAYVTVMNEDVGPGQPRTIPVVNGTFSDMFQGEDVHIYEFTKPPRYGAGG